MDTLNNLQKYFSINTEVAGRVQPASLIFDKDGTHVFKWMWTSSLTGVNEDGVLFPKVPPVFTSQNLNYKFLGCTKPDNCCIYFQDKDQPEKECVVSTDETQYKEIKKELQK